MKIERHDVQTVRFDELKVGECFRINGDIYIKMDVNEQRIVNAVNLADGFTRKLSCVDEVYRVSAKVVVE